METWAVKDSSIIIEMIMMKNDHYHYHYQIKQFANKCDKNTSFLDIREFFMPYRFLYDVEILQKIILMQKNKKIYIQWLVNMSQIWWSIMLFFNNDNIKNLGDP